MTLQFVSLEHHQQVLAELAESTALTTRAIAQAEQYKMLRGVGCSEDGDGPCGVCLKCHKARA
jgi:hypothetical protein